MVRRGLSLTLHTRPGKCFACHQNATAAADAPAGIVFACDNHRFVLLDFDSKLHFERTRSGFVNAEGKHLPERNVWDGIKPLLDRAVREGFTR